MFTQSPDRSAAAARPISFDGVRFHPASGRLEVDGRGDTLRPRTAAVLEYLLRARGRLVGKNELLQAVWSDAVVTEDSLSQCVKEIRRALGPHRADLIRTVPRLGYQFAAPIDEEPSDVLAHAPDVASSAASGATGGEAIRSADTGQVAVSVAYAHPAARVAPDVPAEPPRPVPTRPLRVLPILGGALVLVIVAVLVGVGIDRLRAIEDGGAPLSIVVLPLADAGGPPADRWFGDVLTDDLTLRLSQTAGTQVVSADTARRYASDGVDPRVVARELGVRYVVSGSVRREGRQVHLSLSLIEGETGTQRWVQAADIDRATLGPAIDDTVKQLARSLSVQMFRWSGERAAALGAAGVLADDLAMQGWAVYFRGLTPDNLRAAGTFFEAAVVQDPQSVRGWGGIAVVNGLGAYSHWVSDRPAAIARLLQASERLENLDAEGFYAHLARSLRAHVAGDWESVLAANTVGTERFPSHAPSHFSRALAFTALGRFEECLGPANTALRIGPRDAMAGAYHLQAGMCHFMLGRFREAAVSARLGQQASPRLDIPPLLLAAALARDGDAEGARRTMADFRMRRPAFGAENLVRIMRGDEPRYVAGREQLLLTLRELGLP
jgi:DNA-binding winged helix-turn-helix (wHTH) protein/TolB-like protein